MFYIETDICDTIGLQSITRPDSKTWIAGAVVGPVVFIATIAAIAFWIRRRKIGRSISAIARDNDSFEYQGKLQLHGDTADLSKFKSELHADSNVVHEMDVAGQGDIEAELPAVEPVGSELGSLRVVANSTVKRKPLAAPTTWVQ